MGGGLCALGGRNGGGAAKFGTIKPKLRPARH